MTPIRVAVVDDQPSVRDVLVELLEEEDGLEVAGTAGDADGGIELVAARRPDVALVDVRMNGGGPHAAKAIPGLATITLHVNT